MAKMSNRVICFVLTVLMIVGMIPVASAQYVYNAADTQKTFYDVDYTHLVGSAYENIKGVYIVDSDWEFKDGQAPATVTFNFRGQSYTETYNPDRHLYQFSDVYTKAKADGVSLPTCILTEGNYSGNGALTLSSSIILLGAKAGINPNVPNSDPTKEWQLNSNRYYNDDIAEEKTGGESRLWTPGAENPDVGYVEGSSSSFTDKILKITQSTGNGTFVIDGLFFQGYAACLDATANGSGTWNVYVQNCIFGNCYSYDTETLRFWNRGASMSIAKKLYLSNAYVRDNNKNGFYSGHAQTIHVNGLCYQNSEYTCFYNVQNIPWQGYDFSCENSHFWQPDGMSYNRQLFDFNMTSYSNVGPGSETDENKYSFKHNSFYNCTGLTEVLNAEEEVIGYTGTSTTVIDVVIGGSNDNFTFEDNLLMNANTFVAENVPYSPLRLLFTCDKNTNQVTHGWGNDTCTTTMLDPNYVLGEEQINIHNNTFIGGCYMTTALKYGSAGVLNAANKVEMTGNLYLPTMDATKGEIVTQTEAAATAYANQFYDKWVWLDKAMTVKSSDLYESDFVCNTEGLVKNGENWTLPLNYDVMSVDLDIDCNPDNSVVVYKSDADFNKGDALANYTLDTSERTSYYIVSLISIDGRTYKDYKLTVNRTANPAAGLVDVVADPSMSVDLKESYGDGGYRFEVNYDNQSFKFGVEAADGATVTVKNKATGVGVSPSNGIYTINLRNTQQDYIYVITVTDANGNSEKYDLVMYRRLSTRAEITRLTSTGNEITEDLANHTFYIVADATATEVEFDVKISTNASAVLTDDIYGAVIPSSSNINLSYTVDVSAGDNTYNMTVTAQDGVTTILWKIIVSRPKNHACELFSIDDTELTDGVYVANVTTATFFVNAVSSTSSTYHIYTDETCSQEIADPFLTLKDAQTVIWLQIHAEDENYKSVPVKVVINTSADLSEQVPGVHYAPMVDNGIIGVTGATEFIGDIVYINLPENVSEFFLKVMAKGNYLVYLFSDATLTNAVSTEQILKLDSGSTMLYAVAGNPDNTEDVHLYPIVILSPRYAEYTDKLTDWAKPYITKLNETGMGLMRGDEHGAFNGENGLNRYELATMMVRLKGVNKDFYARYELIFTDEIVDWAKNYVKAATKLGLMNGYATYDGDKIVGYTFVGERKATRAEFTRVLLNVVCGDIDAYYALDKNAIDAAAAAANLKDLDKVAEWAKSAIYTAVSFGIISGDEKGYVNADAGITRNEAATIMARFLDMNF